MKYLVLLGDGMADFRLPELNGSTPLAKANTLAMDKVAYRGISGLFCPIPDDLPPGSDVGNLSVFGYDPHACFTGRAPLEAANQGITLAPNQIAFRCNLVTLCDGKMKDFTSGHISTEEATELIQYLDGCFDDVEIKLYPGISYRHLALLTAEEPLLSHLAALDCTPPHDITGKEYPPHLPAGECCQSVVSMMERSAELLSDHPVNKARIASGKQPATSMWLWGQGKTPSMQTFEELYGIKGAVISAVDLVNGIGVTAGLKVVRVEGATGYLDTNYEGKVAAALAALDEVDFVYLHVEAPDEAAHEGKVDLKIQAIEDFDSRIVAPCLDYLDTHPDCRILVAPDHVTSIESMTHAGGPIPFALCGAGVEADACTSYNEVAAAEQGVLFPIGHKLLPYMLNTESISSRTLP